MPSLVVPGARVETRFDVLPPLPAPSGIVGIVGIVDRRPDGLVGVSRASELRELLGPTLYPLTLGITQDREQAAGAVEQAFAELWERRAWLGRMPALSPWLVERCRAGAVALRSGIALSPPPSLQDRARVVPLTRRFLRCPPDVRVSRINSALDQIGAQEREALILAVRTGRSLGDISSQLGTSTDQMSALLRTGLRQLRQSLEETLRRETT